jgi:sodium pump decarboxylase gamma subunit
MNDLILGLQLTILGMGMVLIILALLYLAVSALGWIVNRERGESLFVPTSTPETAVSAPKTPKTPEVPEGHTVVRDDRERVAAISAAVAAYKRVQKTRSHRSPHMVPYRT